MPTPITTKMSDYIPSLSLKYFCIQSIMEEVLKFGEIPPEKLNFEEFWKSPSFASIVNLAFPSNWISNDFRNCLFLSSKDEIGIYRIRYRGLLQEQKMDLNNIMSNNNTACGTYETVIFRNKKVYS